MEPLVSIIVPIYNIEPYLCRCVDSIINQSYRNLEIILVDDGSPDNCPQICDEYQEKDSRVKVIHKPNGGLSDARNAGLDIATGDYITFVDGDDFLAFDAIEIELAGIQKCKTRISCISNVSVSSDYNTIEIKTTTKERTVISSGDLIKGICEKSESTSVCNKLFEACVINNNRFPRGRLNEDFYFLVNILIDDFDICKIDYPGYYYYSRTDSITHSSNYISLVDSIKNIDDVITDNGENADKYICSFARLALYQIRTLLIVLPSSEIHKGSELLCFIDIELEKYKKYIVTSSLSIIDKMILRCACVNSRVTAKLVKKVRG